MKIARVKVPIELDRPRTLILSFNAFCKAEEVTGIPFLVEQPQFSSLSTVRALFWAGLLHEDPTLTLEQAGDFIEEVGMDTILDAVMKAYGVSMPETAPDDEEMDETDPTRPRPGDSSGASEDTISG
jgi:hypothetical protein